MEFIYKKLCIYYYILKLQLPAVFISCNVPIETFFTLLKMVFELINFDAF